MCSVFALNGAMYEWVRQAPLLMKARAAADGIDTVRTAALHAMGKSEEGGMSEDLWTVVRNVVAMSKDVKVLDETFQGNWADSKEKLVVVLAEGAGSSVLLRMLTWP